MKCLGPAVLTGLMVREHKHFVDTVDRVPFMSGLAVTDPTCQALLAGHRVQIFSTGRPEERPALEAPNRRGRADFAPAPDGGTESGPGGAKSRENPLHKNQCFAPLFFFI